MEFHTMKRILFGLVLCASPVWAGTLSYTTTAAQDTQIAAAATDEGTTVQALVDQAVGDMIAQHYNSLVHRSLSSALDNTWPILGSSRKTNICTQLNVSPCPP